MVALSLFWRDRYLEATSSKPRANEAWQVLDANGEVIPKTQLDWYWISEEVDPINALKADYAAQLEQCYGMLVALWEGFMANTQAPHLDSEELQVAQVRFSHALRRFKTGVLRILRLGRALGNARHHLDGALRRRRRRQRHRGRRGARAASRPLFRPRSQNIYKYYTRHTTLWKQMYRS